MKNIALAALTATTLFFATSEDVFAQNQKKKVRNKDLPQMLQTGSLKAAQKRQKQVAQANQNGANIVCPPPVEDVHYTPADTTKVIEFTHNLDRTPAQERVPVPIVTRPKKRKH